MESHHAVVLRKQITGLYLGTVLRNYIMDLYYRIRLRMHITDCNVLRTCITESYHGTGLLKTILQNAILRNWVAE